ncbi:MAG: hypothetical protein QM784_29925 [Polyangiaceae bacterium]
MSFAITSLKDRPMESGPVTLTYIVGVLLASICAIPLLFLFTPGAEKGEPAPESDEPHAH